MHLESQQQRVQHVQAAQQVLITQRLVQQALQQAAQRMQQNGGSTLNLSSTSLLQAAQAGAAASALMFPGLQQNSNGAASMPVLSLSLSLSS